MTTVKPVYYGTYSKTGVLWDKQSVSFLLIWHLLGDADSLRDRRDSEVGVGDLDGLVDEVVEPTEYEGPSIDKFAGKYPTVWYGAFMLKNTAFPTQMHLIDGL